MTPKRKSYILYGGILCGVLSICKGGGIIISLSLSLGIIIYNAMRSGADYRDSEYHRSRKVVWSKKQQRFIEIPKEQTEWE